MTMDLGLQGKVALVTGASSGIGAATARLLAEEAADVVVGYRSNEQGAKRSAQAVRERDRRAWLLQMDVARPASVNAAVRQLRPQVSGLDIAILCAGRNKITPFEDIEPEEWDEIVGVNLGGTFYMLQAIAPLLQDGSSVVTVASVAAHTGAPHHAHYAAAKAGVVGLTKSAARALAPKVRVNCLAPGLTRTPMGNEAIDTLAEDYAEKKLLTQQFASPEDIARCAVFLASPAARFIVGATIDANGGRDLR